MSQRMSVNIELVRYVSETWCFDLGRNDDPEEIFENIRANPELIWTKFDSHLFMSEDYDEKVTKVSDYELE